MPEASSRCPAGAIGPLPGAPGGFHNGRMSAAPYIPQIRRYQQWLGEHHGLHFADYDALWRWSVTDIEAFWQSIRDYFELHSPTPATAVLERNVMPGARWFPGAQAN